MVSYQQKSVQRFWNIWQGVHRDIFKYLYRNTESVIQTHECTWTIQRPMNKPGIASKVWRHMERCLEKAEMRRKLLDATILKCPGLATDVLGMSESCPDMLEHV
jgi:hypothetical protein